MNKLFTAYSKETDITFIMEESLDDCGNTTSMRVNGWYFGAPDEDFDVFYHGRNEAFFDSSGNVVIEQMQSKYWDSMTLSVITLEELQKRYMNGDAWRKMSFAEYLGNLLKEDDGDINLFTLNEAYKMYSNDIENDIKLWKESCDVAGCEPTSFQGMEIYHKYYAEGIELTMDIVHDIVKEM